LIPSNNKSFTIERPDKSLVLQTETSTRPRKYKKEKITCSQAIPEDVAETLPTSKSIALNVASGKSIESNLKHQLKL
jgi:hypothetical protein